MIDLGFSRGAYSEHGARMAGFVRWIAVLLAFFAVFEQNAANPIQSDANQGDAIENSEDPAFVVDNRGRRDCAKHLEISFLLAATLLRSVLFSFSNSFSFHFYN